MFSSNDKISSRQINRLLVFDLFGAGSLILPAHLARSGNGIGVWSILAGTAFAGIYLWLLHACSSRTVPDYMGFLKTGWGNILSRLLYLCYAVISVLTCAWAAKLLADLVCDSLLDSREFMTALLVILLLAFYGASAGIEARARIYEILFWVLVIPLVIMLLLCVRQVQVIQWFPLFGDGDAISWSWFWSGTWQCFAAFLPLTFLLFLVPHEQDQKKSGRAAACAVVASGLALAVIYLVLLGIFGSGALAREEYPVITLMGMVKIPGDFLKRLDAVMVGGWFFTLYALIGTTLFYGVVIMHRALTVSAVSGQHKHASKAGRQRIQDGKADRQGISGSEAGRQGIQYGEAGRKEALDSEAGSQEIQDGMVGQNMQNMQGMDGCFFAAAVVVYGIAYGFHTWPQLEELAGRLFYQAGVPFAVIVPMISLLLCKGEAD